MTRNLPMAIVANDSKLRDLCLQAWEQSPWLDATPKGLRVDWDIFAKGVDHDLSPKEIALMKVVASDFDLEALVTGSARSELRSFRSYYPVATPTVDLPDPYQKLTITDWVRASQKWPDELKVADSRPKSSSSEPIDELSRLLRKKILLLVAYRRSFPSAYCFPELTPWNQDMMASALLESWYLRRSFSVTNERPLALCRSYLELEHYRRPLLDYSDQGSFPQPDFWQGLFECTQKVRLALANSRSEFEQTEEPGEPLNFRYAEGQRTKLVDMCNRIRKIIHELRDSNESYGRRDLMELLYLIDQLCEDALLERSHERFRIPGIRRTSKILDLLLVHSPFLMLLHSGFLTIMKAKDQWMLGLSPDVMQAEICRRSIGEPWAVRQMRE